MSVSILQSKIKRLSGEIDRLQKDLSKLIKDEADCNKAVSRAMNNINRTKNISTVQSNQRTVESNNKKIAGIIGKKADIQKKISSKNIELSKAGLDLEKESAKEQKKLLLKQQKELQQIHVQQKGALSLISTDYPNDVTLTDPEKEYDIFISHASEDKGDFVNKLTDELKRREINIWYDSESIGWGASIRQSIDLGLRNSKYGIVVISPKYIEKYWTQYELDGFLKKESSMGKQTVLPIWHKITADEVQNYSYSLADKLAFNTAINTVAEIADAVDSLVK